MKNLIIIGNGPNARQAYEFVQQYNTYKVIGFAVNASYLKEEFFCGLSVFCLENLKNKTDVEFEVFCQVNLE